MSPWAVWKPVTVNLLLLQMAYMEPNYHLTLISSLLQFYINMGPLSAKFQVVTEKETERESPKTSAKM